MFHQVVAQQRKHVREHSPASVRTQCKPMDTCTHDVHACNHTEGGRKTHARAHTLAHTHARTCTHSCAHAHSMRRAPVGSSCLSLRDSCTLFLLSPPFTSIRRSHFLLLCVDASCLLLCRLLSHTYLAASRRSQTIAAIAKEVGFKQARSPPNLQCIPCHLRGIGGLCTTKRIVYDLPAAQVVRALHVYLPLRSSSRK
eukprot:6091881-Pleurochrysis_carterae.AAC.4